ncbi:MAG: universal stress protein [Nitrospirae bacterium]|nr:universal stress protein [Nitrospirota bacterium]
MMRIRRILFPTDFSNTAKQALTHALFLAEQFEAELHMLHAVILHESDPRDPDRHFPEPSDILNRLVEIADSEMAEIMRQHESRTFTIREAKVRGYSAGEVILEYAKEHDIDLVVMGTHGRRGPARLFLGSVAEEVVRHASCPVLTLREAESPRTIEAMEKILVPVDFSPYSEEALSYAKELATLYGAGLQLLHTIEEPAYPYFYNPGVTFSPIEHLEALRVKAEEAMDKLLAETKGPEVPAERFVATGRPSSEIAGFAEEHGSDMVVIATHGLTGLERLLVGSTAEHVVRLAPCPVFTVKSFGKSLI